MLKVRASSLGLLMTEAKYIDQSLLVGDLLALHKSRPSKEEAKAEKEKLLAPLKEKTLSAGAKTFVEGLAKQFVYNYEPDITSRPMNKGIIVEQQSIDLYNSCFFTSHQKNAERRTVGYLTGAPDIVDLLDRKIIDIKSSWSLETFPAIKSSGEEPIYEWQGRAYMMLWPDEVDEFELAYCLVSTPDELIGHDAEAIHIVDHIDPMLRVTKLNFKRCKVKEALINTKLESAANYFDFVLEQIAAEHA